MSDQETAWKVPAHAARLLAQNEGVRFLTRPRVLPVRMLIFMTAVLLSVSLFSAVIRDPGFMSLLAIPALPVIGGYGAYFILSPAILVTGRRVVFARRFQKPMSLGLRELEAVKLRQSSLERLLGYGAVILLYPHPYNPGEGVFLQYTLENLRDAASLGSAVSAAAEACKSEKS